MTKQIKPKKVFTVKKKERRLKEILAISSLNNDLIEEIEKMKITDSKLLQMASRGPITNPISAQYFYNRAIDEVLTFLKDKSRKGKV